jgi:4-hydroxy-4-methyl-2-oxoglutarate aldolase
MKPSARESKLSSDSGWYERLRQLPVAVLSDVVSAMGLHDQIVSSTIRPYGLTTVVAGPAVCLAGREGPEPPPSPDVSKPVFEMDRHVSEGCIVVIAGGGHRVGATVGGNVALSWKLRGCTAVVIDGGVRDLAEFDEFALPVFASFATPMSTKGLWNVSEVEVPIALPGQTGVPVRIVPGDAIHADADGVIVIPAAHLQQAVRDAEVFESMEKLVQRDLRSGGDREAIYKRYDKLGHIKPVKASN